MSGLLQLCLVKLCKQISCKPRLSVSAFYPVVYFLCQSTKFVWRQKVQVSLEDGCFKKCLNYRGSPVSPSSTLWAMWQKAWIGNFHCERWSMLLSILKNIATNTASVALPLTDVLVQMLYAGPLRMIALACVHVLVSSLWFCGLGSWYGWFVMHLVDATIASAVDATIFLCVISGMMYHPWRCCHWKSGIEIIFQPGSLSLDKTNMFLFVAKFRWQCFLKLKQFGDFL